MYVCCRTFSNVDDTSVAESDEDAESTAGELTTSAGENEPVPGTSAVSASPASPSSDTTSNSRSASTTGKRKRQPPTTVDAFAELVNYLTKKNCNKERDEDELFMLSFVPLLKRLYTWGWTVFGE